MNVTLSQANMRMQSVTRTSKQPVSRASSLLTPTNSVFGSRLDTTKAWGRCRQDQRQLLTRAADDKNPIEKAKQAAKDFGDEVKGNAEGSAEKVEDAYKQANPEEGEKTPSDQYRSTELKNSKEKYTPKSDPKK